MESFLTNLNSESIEESPQINVPIKRKKGRPPKVKQADVIVKEPAYALDTLDALGTILPTINTDDHPQTEQQSIQCPEEKVKQKRGRKKKEKPPEEEVKIKKKRGRKAALKFYSSSIRKKIPINTDYQNNETIILHINVNNEDTENQESDTIYTIKDNELKSDTLHLYDTKDEEDDILEAYLNEKDVDPSITLKTLYDQKIEQRKVQDSEILDKLHAVDYPDELLDELDELKTDNIHDKSTISLEEQREKDKKNGYITVMYEMIENKYWLEKTNIKCWWCCHSFDTPPLSMPIKYHDETKKFLVKGCFCSIGCLLTYHKSNLRSLSKTPHSYSLIKYMYTKLYGKSIFDKLTQAPPRESLIDFGGTLTIDEFRNASNNGKMYKLIEYPMIVVRDFIEEIDLNILKEKNSNRNNKSKLTLQDNQIKEAKQRLSMIEVSNTQNTIDKFINLSKL